ncbi:N-6 DNA methylase [Chryseobacterium sp. MHB01]|uniref:N-6 DNA methylase n=1 Tax=Chryseobacterium sp. MHB01 TaxID=3109433 RepID=UPI002AFE1508|nr:N-6 DNA methylase [Chryseobacterium sp. MHB01]MEA1849240.1 N-6 DNA methylase [Chryseobacterium sp. MHB01]
MTKNTVLSIFKIEDILELPSAISMLLEEDFDQRNDIYKQLLDANNNDLSYDWFQELYEDDFAQRKQDKQDFTPNSVGVLLSQITGCEPGRIYEPTAGNGSLLIANWWYRKNNSVNFNTSDYPIECWDLSNRSLPILLLNLSIRNIQGNVFHGNVLSKEIRATYLLTSDIKFSKINKL